MGLVASLGGPQVARAQSLPHPTLPALPRPQRTRVILPDLLCLSTQGERDQVL